MRRLSLRSRLFLLLILPLVVIAGIASYARYEAAERLSRSLYDNTLLAVALTISRDVAISEGDVLTEQLLEELTTALGDPVYYRITGPGGGFVTGYSDPPDVPDGSDIQSGKPFFFDSTYLGRQVRSVVLREFLNQPRLQGWMTVEVWQTVSQRAALSRELLLQSVALLTTVILSAAVILWFGIKLGLKPLLDLQNAISLRTPDDLKPIRRWIPVELRPLVETTNSLFERLSKAFEIRSAFISDAAHQLRNPIASIVTQAEAAVSSPDESTLRQRVASIAQSARATGRLTNQLLSLERVRGRSLRALFKDTDLVDLVSAKIRAFAEVQLMNNISVGFEVDGVPKSVFCDPVMIDELMANLLDNALRYGLRGGGELVVRLAFSEDVVLVIVEDNGPGIDPDLRERVFDRFFRAGLDFDDGCGLGLAIVADIAEAHGGAARCVPSVRGARFEIRLPLAGH
ncbi:two-component system, OmpR family, sensor histidine kinase TctE [Rhizobium sp. RU20A]|uniref:sensor histidine kinase n=1 Tax=Rhizobium sp. RU20A TaxID=1907412 RepID=UPI00095531C3|nr:sensor histidine kinase [Rhizobium sp. RU20A]SIR37975.1 two-component system, OmpR family, sensor histidine kinase TctE [Rhizobium sp. RU20A]